MRIINIILIVRIACTVVIRPLTMPNLSLSTFATGPIQLVVQDALLKMSYVSTSNWLSFTL